MTDISKNEIIVKPTSRQEDLDRAWLSGSSFGYERAIDDITKAIGLPRDLVLHDTDLRKQYVEDLKEFDEKARVRFMDPYPDDSFNYISEPEAYLPRDMIKTVPSREDFWEKYKFQTGLVLGMSLVAITEIIIRII